MPDPAGLPPQWDLCSIATPEAPEPLEIIRLHDHKSLIPDPVGVSKYGTDVIKHAELEPSYQAWRQLQVIENLPLMGWDLPRGSMPGTWAIVGNGPGAHVPPDCDRVLAINGALEIPGHTDIWMVADALRPTNSWGKIITEWLKEHERLVSMTTLVARVAACHEVCAAAGDVHFYKPCTREHRDVIPPWVAARLPTFVDAFQSLPCAMHLAWWMGADAIKIAGCPQGMAAGQGYYATDVPNPKGRFRQRLAMPGVNGPVFTTPSHIHARDQADAVAFFLRRAGVRLDDHSGGLIYRYAEAVA